MLCWVSRESVLGSLGCLWWVSILQASVFEWMQRTLEVEFKEWFREEEPETDHQGFFQSALPSIVMQVGPQEHGDRWGMAMLRPPKKESVACRLSLNHLHFPLLLQMLNENIQVASLITDSLQQKIYNMALEELEAFLGRSVEPLTPLSTLTPRGAMAKHHRLVVEMCCGAPNAHPGHRRLSSLSTHGAAVSAFGGISSRGLLPQMLVC